MAAFTNAALCCFVLLVGVGISGVIFVAIFLDQFDKKEVNEFKTQKINVCTHFVATLTHLKDKRQILLIVMTMYSGFEQGFLAGDYTKVRILKARFDIFKQSKCIK